MTAQIPDINVVAAACSAADAGAGMQSLLAGLKASLPELAFRPVLSRSGWHRLGGVLDAEHGHLSDNICHWLEQQGAEEDLDGFVERFSEQGLIATRVQGKTHYLTAEIGPAPEDFVQLEVEELQEVTDRILLPEDWQPDDLEDLLDPMDRQALPADPVGNARFVFRRIQSVPELLQSAGDKLSPLKRFMYDWTASSAGKDARFSQHWVLSLRETEASDGSLTVSAKPIPACALPDAQLADYNGEQGEALLGRIRHFDLAAGYPFAWFFAMLTSRKVPFDVGEAVLADLAADFDYLPPRDVLVLGAWATKRYAV